MLYVYHANHLVCALVDLRVVAAELGVVHAFLEAARRVGHGLACREVLANFQALVRQDELNELATSLASFFQDVVVGFREELFIRCFHECLQV